MQAIGDAGLSPSKRVGLKEQIEVICPLEIEGSRLAFSVGSRTELGRVAKIKEPWTVDWIRALPKGAVLWDVGANIGVFALLAAEGGASAVVALEPAYLNYASLVRNLLHNGLQAKVLALPVGLGAATAALNLNLESLDAGGGLHSFGPLVQIKGRSTDPIATCGCLCYRADDLVRMEGVPFPTHFKIDVDGFELETLQGAAQVLEDPRVQGLQVEVVDYDLQDRPRRAAIVTLLAAAGFKLEQTFDHSEGPPMVTDLQFRRA